MLLSCATIKVFPSVESAISLIFPCVLLVMEHPENYPPTPTTSPRISRNTEAEDEEPPPAYARVVSAHDAHGDAGITTRRNLTAGAEGHSGHNTASNIITVETSLNHTDTPNSETTNQGEDTSTSIPTDCEVVGSEESNAMEERQARPLSTSDHNREISNATNASILREPENVPEHISGSNPVAIWL